MTPRCHDCDVDLTGMTGWVEDVKVIDLATGSVSVKPRYYCDDCEGER